MSVHKQEQRQSQATEAAEEITWSAPSTSDVGDILDEIDAVLEVNAEEFVRSFVQKGGQ